MSAFRRRVSSLLIYFPLVPLDFAHAPGAVQALPLVRPQRRAPEPWDGRPLLPLFPSLWAQRGRKTANLEEEGTSHLSLVPLSSPAALTGLSGQSVGRRAVR